MALIDNSYFVGTLNIPNTNKTEVSERLTWFIENYESELLRALFGYELSNAFDTGTSAYDPDGSNPTIDQKWLDLIDGAEYTKNSKLYKYDGLPKIIARYVYWHWIEDQHTQTVGLGEVAAKAENAELANPAVKMIRAWNEMSDMIGHLYNFLQENKDTYPEWADQDKVQMLCKFQQLNHWGF